MICTCGFLRYFFRKVKRCCLNFCGQLVFKEKVNYSTKALLEPGVSWTVENQSGRPSRRTVCLDCLTLLFGAQIHIWHTTIANKSSKSLWPPGWTPLAVIHVLSEDWCQVSLCHQSQLRSIMFQTQQSTEMKPAIMACNVCPPRWIGLIHHNKRDLLLRVVTWRNLIISKMVNANSWWYRLCVDRSGPGWLPGDDPGWTQPSV